MSSIFHGFISYLKDGMTRAVRVKSEATVVNDKGSPVPVKLIDSVPVEVSNSKVAEDRLLNVDNSTKAVNTTLNNKLSELSTNDKNINSKLADIEQKLIALDEKLQSVVDNTTLSQVHVTGSHFRLSTEEKPTSVDGVKDGHNLLEVDTNKKFVFYQEEWRELTV